MFSRSLRLYKRQGIRVNVLCPEVRVVFEKYMLIVILYNVIFILQIVGTLLRIL